MTTTESPPDIKPKAVKKQGGFRRSYWRKAYQLLDPHMDGMYRRFASTEDKVRRAGIRLSYRVYMCGLVFTTIIVAIASLVVSGVIIALLPISIFAKIGLPIGIGLAGAVVAFAVQLFYPRIRMGGRKRQIDEDLAFVVGRMAVLSASGMTPEQIINEVARDDSNDPLVIEFRKMIRDMNLLGMDLTQALKEERKRTPSDLFAQFLDGMMATASSGADINSYLVKQGKSLMNDKRLKAKSISESLGVVAEMYTTVLVVMPLILIILFAVMGVITGSLGGINIYTLMSVVVYLMVPLGGIMIMVIADGIVPKR